MKLLVKVNGMELTARDRRMLERRIDRLERRVQRFDPDLVSLEVVLDKQPRREEYLGRVRLAIGREVLPAVRNAAPTLAAVIREAFEDVEEKLTASQARLRRQAYRRKRGARSPGAIRTASRELTEERALLATSLTGDRGAFDRAAEDHLAGLHRLVVELHARERRPATTEAVDAAVAHAMAVAFEELHHKPERWTMRGWLAHVARRENRRQVKA